MTTQSWPDTERGEAVTRWFKAMAPIHQTEAMILSVVDPEQYSYNRAICDHWANEGSLVNFKRTGRMAWVYYPTLVNARVNPHKDKHDLLSGLVSMTCCGDFEGGNVVVPVLGKQYQVRNGDILLLRAPLLDHWISPYEGPRYSFVHAIPEDMCNLKAAIPARTPGEKKEHKRIRKEARAKDATDPDRIKCPMCAKPMKSEGGLRKHLAPYIGSQPKFDRTGHHTTAKVHEHLLNRERSLGTNKKMKHGEREAADIE
jgi:hypothetical protein